MCRPLGSTCGPAEHQQSSSRAERSRAEPQHREQQHIAVANSNSGLRALQAPLQFGSATYCHGPVQVQCKLGGLAKINSRILQRRIVVFYVFQQNGNNILLRMIGQIYEWMQVRRGWPQAPLTGVNRTMGTRGG